MYTLRLWRHIMRPTRYSPAFRRARIYHPTPNTSRAGRFSWWALISLMLVVGVVFSGSIITVVIGVMAVAISLPVFFLVISGTLIGSYNAWQTSALLSRYRQNHWQDYLGVTPDGWLGNTWATMLGVLHRAERVTQAYKIVRYVVVFGLVTMGMSMVMVTISVMGMSEAVRQDQADKQIIVALLPLLLMFIILYIDFVQSTILSGIVGIIIGNTTIDPIDARLRAVGIFVTIQIMSYFLSWLSTIMLEVLIRTFVTDALLISLLGALTFITFFYVIREALIDGLIQWMIYQLEATPSEWQTLIHD